jgi:hypothetical protein
MYDTWWETTSRISVGTYQMSSHISSYESETAGDGPISVKPSTPRHISNISTSYSARPHRSRISNRPMAIFRLNLTRTYKIQHQGIFCVDTDRGGPVEFLSMILQLPLPHHLISRLRCSAFRLSIPSVACFPILQPFTRRWHPGHPWAHRSGSRWRRGGGWSSCSACGRCRWSFSAWPSRSS